MLVQAKPVTDTVPSGLLLVATPAQCAEDKVSMKWRPLLCSPRDLEQAAWLSF